MKPSQKNQNFCSGKCYDQYDKPELLTLAVYTNLNEKFKIPLLKKMAEKPLIIENVVRFEVLDKR